MPVEVAGFHMFGGLAALLTECFAADSWFEDPDTAESR